VAAFVALVFPGAAHPAYATEGDAQGTLKVTPSTVGPGEDADLRIDICKGEEAVGSSRAFVADAWFGPAADGGLFAEATVKSSLAEGTYEVQVVCTDSKDKGGKSKATGTLTVVPKASKGEKGVKGEEERKAPPSPTAPVRAGGGGTAQLVVGGGDTHSAGVVTPDISGTARLTAEAAADAEGPGTRHTLVGLALAGAAVTAVVARTLRHRRRSSGD
jgi:hypothetical protein